LSGARLDYADLSKAKLTNVNLGGASLRFATLSTADLQAARLTGADLAYARFDYANLSGANLSGARLDYVDFAGANLRKTDLRGASLQHAKNLTRKQLEEARRSASTILPPHLKKSSRAKRQINAPERCAKPRPQPTNNLDVPKGDNYNRVIRIAGAILLGALVTFDVVWKHIDEAVPVPTSIAQIGSEQSLPLPPATVESALGVSLQDKAPDLRPAALESPVLVATTALAVSQNVTIPVPELLDEVSQFSSRVLVAPPPALSRGATVAISTLQTNVPEASPLVAEGSPLRMSLQAAIPKLRIETLEASALISSVSHRSISQLDERPDIDPGLRSLG
jgi:Pentapeptide repeats (8 copies)